MYVQICESIFVERIYCSFIGQDDCNILFNLSGVINSSKGADTMIEEYFISTRIINGKPKNVIVDKNGKIVDRNPTKEELLYLEKELCQKHVKNRSLIKYNETNTCDKIKKIGYSWRRCGNKLIPHASAFQEKDRYGAPTGRWICIECYRKYRYHNFVKYDPNSTNNMIKLMADSRTNNLKITTTTSQGLIIEACIAKVRGLIVNVIELDNFETRYDLSYDKEYGIIQSKSSTLSRQTVTGRLIWHFQGLYNDNYDHAMLSCMDDNIPWQGYERMYIIPRKHFIGRPQFDLYKDPTKTTWYDNPKLHFRMDEKPYDLAYRSLMKYIGDRKKFGIEDIKEWLGDKQ